MLEQNVFATITYYDTLSKPLTAWEVFKYLVRPPQERNSQVKQEIKFSDILAALENSELLKQKIGNKNGFYFLANRENIVRQRIERQKEAERKWKKAKKLIRLLEIAPFVRLIMVAGSLCFNNTKENSDIDLLIAVKSGRIWSARAAAAFLAQIFGQYRHKNKTKNRLCLNHFITASSLHIPWPSLYNAQTYAHLVPLWQAFNALYRDFQKDNLWLKDYLFFYPEQNRGYLRKVKPSFILKIIRQLEEFLLTGLLGDILEKNLKKIQKNRFENDSLRYKPGGRIIFNDEQLEFHNDSPEKNIISGYNQKMSGLGLNNWPKEKDSGLTI